MTTKPAERREEVIVAASVLRALRVYFLALVYGSWLVAKGLLRRAWSAAPPPAPARDDPPPLLLDSSVGRHSYVKIQGLKLHYVVAGAEGAPPVLLLHGFPDCWLGWRGQLRALAATHRVLALDLPGCGDSDKPASAAEYTPRRLLDALRPILASLAAAPPHRPAALVGHDLGGLLAWYAAHAFPELLERVAVISAPHPNVFWETVPRDAPLGRAWLLAAPLPGLERLLHAEGPRLLSRCLPHARRELLPAYRYVFSGRADWAAPLNYFRSLIFWRVAEGAALVSLPVLLITGNKDPQVPLEAIVRSAEWCTRSTLKIVDGAAHHPHHHDPAAFNRLLLDFLVGDRRAPAPGLSARGLVGRVLGAVHLFS